MLKDAQRKRTKMNCMRAYNIKYRTRMSFIHWVNPTTLIPFYRLSIREQAIETSSQHYSNSRRPKIYRLSPRSKIFFKLFPTNQIPLLKSLSNQSNCRYTYYLKVDIARFGMQWEVVPMASNKRHKLFKIHFQITN